MFGVWEQQKLDDLYIFAGSGGTPKSTNQQYYNGSIPFLGISDITGRDITQTKKTITEEGLHHSTAWIVPAGAISLAMYASVGEIGILTHDTATSQAFYNMVFDDDRVRDFIYYRLFKAAEQAEYEPLISTGTQRNLNAEKIKNFTVQVTSVDEMGAIGHFFRKLDDLIGLHQRQTQKLTELKQGLLHEMFPREGESVPQLRFPGFTDTWKQKQFKDLFTECREKTTVENEDILLSCAINGIFLNKELFSHFRGSTTIGYLKVKKNDLILSAQNLHLGNANVNQCFESGIVSPVYKVFHIIDCDPNFVQTWVKREITKNFFLACTTEGASTCRKNVDWALLNRSILQVPHINEQRKIGSFFRKLDDCIHLHERYVMTLIHLKKGLLQKMFPQD